jgi:endonuclease-8
MPEGDTVFRTAHRLHTALAGQTLTRGEIRHPRWAEADLSGWRIQAVVPVGKHIFVRMASATDTATSLHSHLKMDGSWRLYGPGERWRVPAHHVRVVLRFPERVALGARLHELELLPTAEEPRLIGHLGPDLLAEDWSAQHDREALARLSQAGSTELGLALLDQPIVAGIGNVYQCETCFRLGRSPFTPISALAEGDLAAAIATARRLLRANRWRPARSTTGETTRDRRHWVYDRAGRPCMRCGSAIRRAALGTGPQARDTFFCPRCQPAPST